MNDNRNYDYDAYPEEKRLEYDRIARWVPPGSRVLDLGCGNGALMELLQENNCICKGIELSESGVRHCLDKGLDVQQGRIDEELPFESGSFDVAVCNVTIQMVLYPEKLLKEMKRVAARQIVSFPNFAYFKNRFDLLVNGRMPCQLLFGYQWYSTGHIHQLSLKDYYTLVRDIGGLSIQRRDAVPVGYSLLDAAGRIFPNLFQKTIIVETKNI